MRGESKLSPKYITSLLKFVSRQLRLFRQINSFKIFLDVINPLKMITTAARAAEASLFLGNNEVCDVNTIMRRLIYVYCS